MHTNRAVLSTFVLSALLGFAVVGPALAVVESDLEESAVEDVEEQPFDPDDLVDDGLLNAHDELGEGSCDAEAMGVDEVTTCRFPFIGDDRDSEAGLALQSAASGAIVSDRCFAEGDQLVCQDVTTGGRTGLQRMTFALHPFDDRTVAQVNANRTTDGVLGLVVSELRPASYVGSTQVEVFRSFALGRDRAADLLLRRDGSDEVVARVPALAPGDERAVVELPFTESGRWTLTGCAVPNDAEPGDETAGCDAEGMRRPWQTVDPAPLPLLEGHNLAGATRVQLVFYGSGWDEDLEGLRTTAERILTLDGQPIAEREDGEIYHLGWGPFAIEPLRGNAHRFDVWYLAEDTHSRGLSFNPGLGDGVALGADPAELGLDGPVVMINLDRDGALAGVRATAEDPSFAFETTLPSASEMAMGSIHLPFSFTLDSQAAPTLAHELGHAVFGLRDEYVEPGVAEPVLGAPNCAGDAEEAEALWGDLVGEIDPMLARWRDAQQAAGLWFAEGDGSDMVRVGYVEGGCFSTSSRVLRPTENSLMSSEIPVFGAVNRRQVQRVLDLFDGTAVFAPDVHGADAASFGCERAPDGAGGVDCTLELAPWLRPAGPVTLEAQVGASASASPSASGGVACSESVTATDTEAGAGAVTSAPSLWTCPQLTAAGVGSALLHLGDGVTLETSWQPLAASGQDGNDSDSPLELSVPRHRLVPLVIGGGALLVLLLIGGLSLRERRRA